MSKKIMIITGTARENGNTFKMVDSFVKEAKNQGHTITRFDTGKKKLFGCHGCETCYSTGKACTYDDEFNDIAPSILEADVLVFAAPVYWYSFPAQIKCVLDRMFSFVIGEKTSKIKMLR